MKCQSYLPHLPLYNSTSNLEVCNSRMKGESLKKAKLKLWKLLLLTYFILFIEEIDRSPVLPETFCQKKRSYSKITEKRTFYPKITEKRTFWPKKTEKERNSGAQKNGLRSLERVLATLSIPGWLKILNWKAHILRFSKDFLQILLKMCAFYTIEKQIKSATSLWK